MAGRFATKIDLVLETRWGRGNLSLGWRSCLMYGLRTSSLFAISTTRRIYNDHREKIRMVGEMMIMVRVKGRTWKAQV